MPDATPLVSIVVPVWQQGRFLGSALESLLDQTYPHLEIIVQDNCSTDETEHVLERFRPRLACVVQEKDAGQSDALRRGFARCHGEILGWLNGDDLLMPDAIERAVAAFAAEPHPDVVYGHCVFLQENGQFLRYFHEIQPHRAEDLLNFSDYLCQPSTFFRRASYEKVGGLDEHLHFGMDWDLWCRFVEAGCVFRQIDEVLSGVRIYSAAKTYAGGMRRIAELYRINLRHKTTRFPYAAASYFLSDMIGGRLHLLHGLLRRAWRLTTGRAQAKSSVVRGLGAPDLIVEPEARVQLPVYARVASARVDIYRHWGGAPEFELEATLNGRPGTIISPNRAHHRVHWHLDEAPFLKALDIRFALGCTDMKRYPIRILDLTYAGPNGAGPA
ncbi:MAG: glycosyltransferase [Planctomycetes bacterium]|nr:glycosyltransferase [Planctomycetota bacterium]